MLYRRIIIANLYPIMSRTMKLVAFCSKTGDHRQQILFQIILILLSGIDKKNNIYLPFCQYNSKRETNSLFDFDLVRHDIGHGHDATQRASIKKN